MKRLIFEYVNIEKSKYICFYIKNKYKINIY